MKLNWKIAIATFLSLAVTIIGISHFRLNKHAIEAMEFRHVDVLAYYRYGFLPDSVVLDIRDVGPENSAAATIGGLIEFADALSERKFREVILAWRGEPRFIIDGRDFQSMGREAPFQNPVYTIRTLPEKLRRPNGSRAFSVWTGGMIGVLGVQMDDVNEFARQWYMLDAISRL